MIVCACRCVDGKEGSNEAHLQDLDARQAVYQLASGREGIAHWVVERMTALKQVRTATGGCSRCSYE